MAVMRTVLHQLDEKMTAVGHSSVFLEESHQSLCIGLLNHELSYFSVTPAGPAMPQKELGGHQCAEQLKYLQVRYARYASYCYIHIISIYHITLDKTELQEEV